jgi:hypothetical protein
MSLNVSSNNLTRGALKPNDWAGKHYEADWGEEDVHWETDLSVVVALADAIKDMRAISSVNLLKNRIPVEQAQELVKIMQSKEKLVTMCGLRKDETELDFSGQNLDAGDAVLIANDISDMRALSSLNLASNNIGGSSDVCGNFIATPEGTVLE